MKYVIETSKQDGKWIMQDEESETFGQIVSLEMEKGSSGNSYPKLTVQDTQGVHSHIVAWARSVRSCVDAWTADTARWVGQTVRIAVKNRRITIQPYPQQGASHVQ